VKFSSGNLPLSGEYRTIPKFLTQWLQSVYSFEKLYSFDKSANYGDCDPSNLLFLLVDVSAGTPEIHRRGVFQQNRSIAKPDQQFGKKRF
jgi:hypothetical protein